MSKNIFDLFNEQNPKAEQRAVDEKVVPREPETEEEKIVEKTEPETEPKTEPKTEPTPEPKTDAVQEKESEGAENV